jgi:hypothetical protein
MTPQNTNQTNVIFMPLQALLAPFCLSRGLPWGCACKAHGGDPHLSP